MNKPVVTSQVDAELALAIERYSKRNQNSAAVHRSARDVMPGGNTRTVLFNDPFPLRIVKGHEASLTDADGHEYLNLLGEYTAGLFGHSHPVIRQAIDNALDNGINLSGHGENEVRLAELICGRFPSIERVRFTNSGTEANLMAISSARFVTGKSKVMVFDGGYHGGLLYFGQGGIPINAPFDYILGSYNDINATQSLIKQHGNELACVLVEPMMGSAGCIPGQLDFLRMLRDESEKNHVILIFDEVMTSRLSSGGAQQTLNVIPDMTTLGKYIGGGMSFGAFGGTQNIMEIFNPMGKTRIPHAGTFNNNSVSMAAGVAAMDTVFTPETALALTQRGDMLRERLNSICKSYSVPVQFTGLGSLMNLHGTAHPIARPNDLSASDDGIKALIFYDLLELGYYIARRGFIALMLSVSDKELEQFCETFRNVIEKRQSIFNA